MRCPQCSANMGQANFCPSCGHLVLELSEDTPKGAGPTPSKLPLKPAGETLPPKHQPPGPEMTPAGSFEGISASRDYSALLLGVCIFSLLLHPSLAWLMLVVEDYSRDWALLLPAIWIPVSYFLTRLMCRVEPQTGRWTIRHQGLRRVFRWLNSLWFGP